MLHLCMIICKTYLRRLCNVSFILIVIMLFCVWILDVLYPVFVKCYKPIADGCLAFRKKPRRRGESRKQKNFGTNARENVPNNITTEATWLYIHNQGHHFHWYISQVIWKQFFYNTVQQIRNKTLCLNHILLFNWKTFLSRDHWRSLERSGLN